MKDAKTATFSVLDPLRTILVYDFRLLEGKSEKEPQFEIFHHEEMWFVSCSIFSSQQTTVN
jgi:hypothetical protein